MPLLLELFFVFFTIGLFCFGGGYVIIPFIQQEIVSRGWMTVQEFIDIIAVSESTPGPLSVNTATYVGFKLNGLLGATISTFGLVLPAFFVVILVSRLWATEKGKHFFDRIMVGIRPVVVGMIFYAAYSIAKTVLVTSNGTGGASMDFFGVILAIAAFAGTLRLKLHPVLMIGAAAIFGAVFY